MVGGKKGRKTLEREHQHQLALPRPTPPVSGWGCSRGSEVGSGGGAGLGGRWTLNQAARTTAQLIGPRCLIADDFGNAGAVARSRLKEGAGGCKMDAENAGKLRQVGEGQQGVSGRANKRERGGD